MMLVKIGDKKSFIVVNTDQICHIDRRLGCVPMMYMSDGREVRVSDSDIAKILGEK